MSMINDATLEFSAGWVGGAAGLIIGHPLDTIKVRIQSLPYFNVTQCILQTFRNESIYGFYKGMLFPFLSAGFLHSLYFGGYGVVIKCLDNKQAHTEITHIPYSHVFAGSIFGGILQWIPSCPIEVVKIKLQVQTEDRRMGASKILPVRYKSPFDCLRQVWNEKKFKALYRGGAILLYRDVIALAFYLPTYELINRNFLSDLNLLRVTIAGGTAGVVSWFIILPMDFIKSRLQSDNITRAQYRGAWDCAVKSYRGGGLRVFYRGWAMVAIRAFPVNAAIFLVYDKFKAHFCCEFK